MTISYSVARNGSTTCSYNGRALHSRYNPEHEAELFVQTLSVSFRPRAVVVIEPALSYCAPFLRSRFPDACLCAIRVQAALTESDGSWDIVFSLSSPEKKTELAHTLYNHFGEETLSACLSLAWTPAAHAFPELTSAAWSALLAATEKSRTVLYTRSYFASRWLSNAVRYIQSTTTTVGVTPGDTPVVVIASGPSLTGILPLLKKMRQRYFLLAVSSALAPCSTYGIVPDMCIATDGGWWARRHFDRMPVSQMVMALPPEAVYPATQWNDTQLLPLAYGDSLIDTLLHSCGYTPHRAERNGTVSGTAMALACGLTAGPVFLCGLDLAPAAGFQHAQPNALECIHRATDGRLMPKEMRIMRTRFSGAASLALYHDWFSAVPPEITARIYRLRDDHTASAPLGAIRDTDVSFFCHTVRTGGKQMPHITACPPFPDKKTRAARIATFIATAAHTAAWQKEFFPLETVSENRALTETDAAQMHALFIERNKKLCARLQRLISQ